MFCQGFNEKSKKKKKNQNRDGEAHLNAAWLLLVFGFVWKVKKKARGSQNSLKKNNWVAFTA